MALQGRVALVTGAARGIGAAVAKQMARAGATVVVSDIVDASKTASAIEGPCTFVQCDVSSEQSVERLAKTIRDRYGHLDVACNNAGIVETSERTHLKKIRDFDDVLSVNLRGTFLCLKHELPLMLNNGGAVVNIASVGGSLGLPGLADYVASKHGVVGLTKVAALEYAQDGIRVNCVAPGKTDTDMVRNLPSKLTEGIMPHREGMAKPPLQREATVDEIANAVLWLSSDQASFVTGTVLHVDGGLTSI